MKSKKRLGDKNNKREFSHSKGTEIHADNDAIDSSQSLVIHDEWEDHKLLGSILDKIPR